MATGSIRPEKGSVRSLWNTALDTQILLLPLSAVRISMQKLTRFCVLQSIFDTKFKEHLNKLLVSLSYTIYVHSRHVSSL